MYELDKKINEEIIDSNKSMICDWTRSLQKLIDEVSSVTTKKVFAEVIEDPYYKPVRYFVFGKKELQKMIKEGYFDNFFDFKDEDERCEYLKQEYREYECLDDDAEVDMNDVWDADIEGDAMEGHPSFCICEYVA